MHMQQVNPLASWPSSEVDTQPGSPESRLLEAVVFARAVLLARTGELDQAEAILLSLVREGDSRTEVLDLLAKVYAQQDEIEEAQAAWLRALEKDPSNLHFLGALQVCAHYRKSKYRRILLRRSGILGLTLGAVVLAAVVVVLTLFT